MVSVLGGFNAICKEKGYICLKQLEASYTKFKLLTIYCYFYAAFKLPEVFGFHFPTKTLFRYKI